MNYRFAHLADLHLGGWRDKYLTDLNFSTFQKSIQIILDKKLDFVLFAGDIFNNPMPPLDLVDKVIQECMKLKKADIPLYVIGGSHDYSATGKSFIQLLGICRCFYRCWKMGNLLTKIPLNFFQQNIQNIFIFTVLQVKKNNLEQVNLKQSQAIKNKENVFSFFLFHTTLQDLKPKNSKYSSKTHVRHIPKGFDYYAAGHVHSFIEGKIEQAPLYFPGPLFPNSFKELYEEKASFILGNLNTQTKEVKIKREFLDDYKVEHVIF